MTELLTRPENHHYPYAAPLPEHVVSHRNPNDRRWARRIAGGIAVLALIAGGGAGGAVLADHFLVDHTAVTTTSTTTGTTTTTIADTSTATLADIAAAVSPSIVTILVDSNQSSSLGSGVIIGSDGLILTNNHVIEGGGTVSVRLSDGTTVDASVVAADATHDLALVQAAGLTNQTVATFATDDSVAVGDTVLAFGAPLGLEGTVTSGIVSAVDREVDTGDEKLSGLLQTDAAINQGNSGGPLVDTDGRVVGINVAIATADDSTGSVGLGFAIPSDTVTEVVQQLQQQSAE